MCRVADDDDDDDADDDLRNIRTMNNERRPRRRRKMKQQIGIQVNIFILRDTGREQRASARLPSLLCNEQTPPTRLTDYVIFLFDLI